MAGDSPIQAISLLFYISILSSLTNYNESIKNILALVGLQHILSAPFCLPSDSTSPPLKSHQQSRQAFRRSTMGAEGFKRKNTAIMSADVVGYSKLMGDDEAATVRS